MRRVAEAGLHGVRLTDLVNATGLKQPTVSHLIGALMREGLIEQDSESRRFYLGVEAFALGAIASARFGIHKLALDALLQLTATTEDSAFLSIRRDTVSICLHREDGAFPIRTQVLKLVTATKSTLTKLIQRLYVPEAGLPAHDPSRGPD
jgi:DNA-binding IclR family transcriptional regulator